MKRILIPLVAIILAGVAALYARALIEGQKNEMLATAATAPEVTTLSVLTAASDLAPGTFLKPDMLTWQEWPEVDLPDSYIVKGQRNEDDLYGGVIRESIPLGQPIIDRSIVKPGDRGFLAAVLDPGKRAISVPVDEASSHAGLIFPGDRVDLILTQTVDQDASQTSRQRRASETVLDDIRVIAMGRALQVNLEEFRDGNVPQIRTATLEVNPSDAELVALVAEMGKLSLSLRSLAIKDGTSISGRTNGGTDAQSPTWDTDVSRAAGNTVQKNVSLRIIRPSGVEQIDTTGNGEQP